MAKPYQEGATWAFRVRRKGAEVYQGGFKTEAAAKQAMNQSLKQIGIQAEGHGKPVGVGPYRTSLGVGLSDYCTELGESAEVP